MEKELKIDIPEGYEIDKENSTFECIRFKKKEEKKYREKDNNYNGFGVNSYGSIYCDHLSSRPLETSFIFKTEKQAKSALAMAQISQIMANDKRFGGPVTDEEWCGYTTKYVMIRRGNEIAFSTAVTDYRFLAFHKLEQCTLFLNENMDLVKDYLMFD